MRIANKAHLIGVAILLSAQCLSAGAYVQIVGKIQLSRYEDYPKPSAHRQYEFTCVIGQSEWSIETQSFVRGAIERAYSEGPNVRWWRPQGKEFYMKDRRFRAKSRMVDEIYYTTADTTLPSINDPVLLRKFIGELRSARLDPVIQLP